MCFKKIQNHFNFYDNICVYPYLNSLGSHLIYFFAYPRAHIHWKLTLWLQYNLYQWCLYVHRDFYNSSVLQQLFRGTLCYDLAS